MSKKQPDYTYLFIAFMGILFIIQLLMLGKNPLQPWDEAIYAVRVQYLLETGNWLDQTGGAVEGLYSSAHPPLFIWLSSLSVKVFGMNEFGLRFWSLIFGLGSILLIFFINDNKERGFYSAVVLGTIPYFLAYFKMGQLDTIYPFFILLGLYGWKKYCKTNAMKFLLLTGLAFGLAMMSKIIVGFFLPISIGLFLFYQLLFKRKSFSKVLKEFSIILITGLVIALPWLLFMYQKHGQDFLNHYLIFHIVNRVFKGVEQNTQSLGPVFFINQLIVMLSASIWFIIWFGKTIWKNHREESILYLCFLLVPFIVFTVSTTKIRTYVIPMLAPSALLAGMALFEMKKSKTIHLVFLFGAIFLFAWSASQSFRDHIQSFELDVKSMLLLGTVIFSSLLFYFIKLKPKYFLLIVLGFFLIRPLFVHPIQIHDHKMEEISAYFYERNFKNLYYLDTKRTVDDPLITYYFKGIDNGKNPDFVRIRPEEHLPFELSFRNRNSLIIVNVYHENEAYTPYLKEIESKAVLIFEDGLYNVFFW